MALSGLRIFGFQSRMAQMVVDCYKNDSVRFGSGFFDLVWFPDTNKPDHEADDEKGAGWQQHEVVGVVPAAISVQLEDLNSEQGTIPE